MIMFLPIYSEMPKSYQIRADMLEGCLNKPHCKPSRTSFERFKTDTDKKVCATRVWAGNRTRRLLFLAAPRPGRREKCSRSIQPGRPVRFRASNERSATLSDRNPHFQSAGR